MENLTPQATVVVILITCGAAIFYIVVSGQIEDKKLAKAINDGRYYTTECQPIEVNIDNGFLSANTNKLNCNNVIKNVSTEDYDKSIRIYKKSIQESSPDRPQSN